ncbi:MAG: rhodanese-like domain-containing protein [Phycisphaerales bacterium]|nr:rhodanese-like domain-containing protein [Phycisphaerales bacterium]
MHRMLLLTLVLTGCGKTWSDKDLVFVNVDEANALIAREDGTWLKAAKPNAWLDARNPDTYRLGHIPGALNLPLRNVDTQWTRLEDHGSVVVYAGTFNDPIADAMSKALLEKGITHVYTLSGGWKAWMEAGGEVERGPDPDLITDETIEARRVRKRAERSGQPPRR